MPANGLGISRAAPLDRESCRADSSHQNRTDLVDAQRRRLHARVGRRTVVELEAQECSPVL